MNTAIRPWWALTERAVVPAVRSGELAMSLIAPAVFTVGFYLPLKTVMSVTANGIGDYAQFLMPLIALQAIAFTAISAAFLAATDAVDGLNVRFASMPVPVMAPALARLSACLLRCGVALGAAVACGMAIGFRFTGAQGLGFVALLAVVAAIAAVGADLLGTASRSPEGTTQVLMLPQLILGMLSTGFAQVDQFPHWVRPFVAQQPVSRFADALRALAQNAATWPQLWPALAWSAGLLLVVVPLWIRANGRRS